MFNFARKEQSIVFVGNPNVGKSVFFGAFTGVYVEVSNFAGTTVETASGKWRGRTVTDTPGIYGISDFNDEERVARDVILSGDIIINVVDALHLKRDLFLTRQLIDMGKRVIVCLNMMDEVRRLKIKMDAKLLSERLGVPVIPASALRGEGIEELQNAVEDACVGNIMPIILKHKNIAESYADVVLLLEGDREMLKKYRRTDLCMREEIYSLRRKLADKIADEVTAKSTKNFDLSEKIGRLLLRPAFGFPFLIICLILIFWFVGYIAAQVVADFTRGVIMEGIYRPFIVNLISKFIPNGTFFSELFIGEFGILTMTPICVIGLLTPLVAAFYLMLSLLEDSGCIPRIAVLLDRSLSKIGLNGRAIIPLILGFGCVTAATVSTRLLSTRREKTIATALLGITIPCSAQIGIIVGALAPLGVVVCLIYAMTIGAVFIITGTVLNRILPGDSSVLLIELPRMRIPSPKNVLKKTLSKTEGFISEAAGVFIFGSAVLSILKYSGLLGSIITAAEPLISGVLKLPREAAYAFIMGILRRDFGVAGLTGIVMTPKQTLTAMTTLTLFVPCIASVLVMFKERSKTEAAAIWISGFIIALTVGGIMAHVM